MPYPVILATGHTSDRSILDEIVWHVAKTPSDAAHIIIDEVEQIAGSLDTLFIQIQEQIHNYLEIYTYNTHQRYTNIKNEIDLLCMDLTHRIDKRRSVIQLFDAKQQ